MNKYNEIMNGVTVDPEMKRRVMGAVSASIKEQSERVVVTDIPVRRKANRGRTVALISSIAAGVLVIAGVIFVSGYLNRAKSASESIAAHNSKVINLNLDGVIENAAADTQGSEDTQYDSADSHGATYETTAATTTYGDTKSGGDKSISENNYAITKKQPVRTDYKIATTDNRFLNDKWAMSITGAIPFTVKEYSRGKYGDKNIMLYQFTGDDKSFSIYETTDEAAIKSELIGDAANGVKEVTTGGTEIELYSFTVGKGTNSKYSGAVFKKNGKYYLILSSELYDKNVFVTVTDLI